MHTKLTLLIGTLFILLVGCQSDNHTAQHQSNDSVRYNRQDTVDAQSQLATFDPSSLDNQSIKENNKVIWEDNNIRDKAGHNRKAEDEK